MSRVTLGVICGLVFGALDITIMLPMSFADKRAAIHGRFHCPFCNRVRHRHDSVTVAGLGVGLILWTAVKRPGRHHH